MGDIDVLKAQVVRRDTNEPWGFRLQGGCDVGLPLTIIRLTPGSPAARIGLRTGDEIVEIASTSTSSLSHEQALDLINSHLDTILMTVERKVTGYMPVIPHAPAQNATPPLKDYQPMDMTGQRTRIPVVGNPPSHVQTYQVSYPDVDSGRHRSTASYELQQQQQQQPTAAVVDTAQPTYTAYYGVGVQPGHHDNSVHASPPPPTDDWMYGCPQSRTFKILQSVMHNEEPAAGVAGLPPPRSAAMEQMRRERQQQQQWQQPAGRVKVFMPQQYNSPMGMYSAHNVLETFTAQAESMLDTLEKRQPAQAAEEHAPVYSEF